ncbi:MAG: hypothetical protein HY692_06165 [Cyanobacteria bacterium NC_groundwater_1444_Ag_S-0.65um_54_12]|nr:hypothetical protein [Cyanobacteria bacterium NC_groundwater_1444_Ag_S-0.65um_54_12]
MRAPIWAALLLLTGCTAIGDATGVLMPVVPVGQGSVRQFSLLQGPEAELFFPATKRLVLLLSASGSAPPAVAFRVQDSTLLNESPAVDHLGGDAAFTADLRRWHAQIRPARKVQANLAIGTQLDFWINTGDSKSTGDCLRHAVIVYQSAHAHYLADTGPVSGEGPCGGPAGIAPAPEQLRTLAAAFEGGFGDDTAALVPGANSIYQTVTGLFGPDPVGGGIDGDPRTFVVISPAVDHFGKEKGLLGYFWSRDVQPRNGTPDDPRSHSNEHEAIFLTDQIFRQRPYTTFGTLAHEFTHLVIYYQRSALGALGEDAWWDEALAMLAMDRVGYGLRAGNEDIAKDIHYFLVNPVAYSLTQWNRNPNGFAYGLVYLYARFIYDRYGPELFREIIAIPDGAIAAIDRALRRRGTTFEALFSDFMVAMYASGANLIVEPRFRFGTDLSLQASYGRIQLRGIQAPGLTRPGMIEGITLRPWSTAFFELSQASVQPWNISVRVPVPFFGSALTY